MQVYEIPVLQNYSEYFQSRIQNFREGKYIQIIILRETKSYIVFTIDGQNLHVERTPAGIEINHPIDRVVMHESKQIIPERLTGQSLLRQFNLYNHSEICPDYVLYGSIEESSLYQSRVIADSGFLVRSLPQVIRNLGNINKTPCENIMPEVFIPTVETLVDVTKEEFVYVMGNILKTTRYGIEDKWKGFIRNHIVGIYFSDVEVFSNLEMSQSFYDIMSINGSVPENLGLHDFIDKLIPMANQCINRAIGRITMLTDEEIREFLHDINVIYSDQEYLANFLKSFGKISCDYIHQS